MIINTRISRLSAALASAGLLALALPALAAPKDGTVAAGTATITQTSATRTDIVQSTNRAVIDWRSFDIGSGELVNFQVPGASSATLNRVTGGQATAVHGQLRSNGQVFLVNPNGILFGAGAQVDVGALVATTAQPNTQAFMAGRTVFNEPGAASAQVINQGRITAAQGGLVALLAPSVANSGVITARLGTVMLGAGRAFTLDLYGDGMVRLAIDQGVVERIVDVNGQPLASLVRNDGSVMADGGRILLTASAARDVVDQAINLGGLLQARTVSNQGGEIVLSAGSITVAPSAHIDVSGTGTGASANGGRAVLVAQESMRFEGSADARGAGAGDGGFVEVSGKQDLHFGGRVDASSAAGQAGTLLLDPVNVTVDATLAQTLSSQLAAGTNVALQADQNVTVSSAIDGRLTQGGVSGAAFSVNAGNGINLNASVLTANGAINLTSGAGGISMASGSLLSAGTRNISLTATGNISLQHLVTSGAISVNTPGLASFAQALGTVGRPIASFDLVSNPTGGFTGATVLPIIYASGGVSVAGQRSVTVGGGIQSDVGSIVIGRGTPNAAPAAITVQAPVNATAGSVSLEAGSSLTVANGVGLHAGGAATLVAGAGGITMAPSSSVEASTRILLDAVGAVATGALKAGSDIAVTSGTASVSTGGGLRATGTATLAGTDVLIGTGGIRSAGLTVNAQNDIEFSGALETTGTGQTTLTAGRDITMNGEGALIRSGGDITLTAGRYLDLTTAGTREGGPSFITAGTAYVAFVDALQSLVDPTEFLSQLPNWPKASAVARQDQTTLNGQVIVSYSDSNGLVIAEISHAASSPDSMVFRTRNAQSELVEVGSISWTRTSAFNNYRHVTLDCAPNCALNINANIINNDLGPTRIMIDTRTSSSVMVTSPDIGALGQLDLLAWRVKDPYVLQAQVVGELPIFLADNGRAVSFLSSGDVVITSDPAQGNAGINWNGATPFDYTQVTPFADPVQGPVVLFGALSVGGVPLPRGVDNSGAPTLNLSVDDVNVPTAAVPLPAVPQPRGVATGGAPDGVDAVLVASARSPDEPAGEGLPGRAAEGEPETIVFQAGRGVARSADLGRGDSSSQGQPSEVFCGMQHVAGLSRRSAPPTAGTAYFQTDAFGRPAGAACGKRGASR